MPDDRSRHPRRPGVGRRPPYVAGHRRRLPDDVDDPSSLAPEEPSPSEPAVPSERESAPDAATSQERESSVEPVGPVGPGGPVGPVESAAIPDVATGEDASPTDSDSSAPLGTHDPVDRATDEVPPPPAEQIRVAPSVWSADPPPAPPAEPAEPAEPRRTPTVAEGPDGSPVGTLPAELPAQPAPPAHPGSSDAPAATVSPTFEPGLTSPPLDAEPWAGIPAATAPVEEVAASSWSAAAAVTDGEQTSAAVVRPDEGSTAVDAAASPAAASPAAELPAAELPVTEPPVSDIGVADLAEGDLPVGDPVSSGRHRRPTLLHRRSGAEGEESSSAAPAEGVPDARSRWERTREPLLIVALTVALALGGLNVWTHFVRSPGNHLTSSSSKAAATAASAVVVPLLSYNYATIDQQVAKVTPLATELCGTQYANDINKVVKPLSTQNKAVMQAQVLSVGVQDASADRVDVLAFVQTTSSNKARTTTQINEDQLTLTMVKQHGKWLLSGTSANGSGRTTPTC